MRGAFFLYSKLLCYKGDWYYLGNDGAMVKGKQTIDGKRYIMDDQGQMIADPALFVKKYLKKT